MELQQAAAAIGDFQRGSLTARLAGLEAQFRGADRSQAQRLCDHESIDPSLIEAALELKTVAGQINVVMHGLGILAALPSILNDGEQITHLSLGAGNTGRAFDLETNRRIAEFKFIRWRGGSETIRQNSLFKDFYGLAESKERKERYLYVLGSDRPMKFLTGRRSLKSVMSKNNALLGEFTDRYGNEFKVVRDYYMFRRDRVRVVDLLAVAPHLSVLAESMDGVE